MNTIGKLFFLLNISGLLHLLSCTDAPELKEATYSHRISGQIFNLINKETVSQAEIRFNNNLIGLSDESGEFDFELTDLEEGVYTISFIKQGFQKEIRPLTISANKPFSNFEGIPFDPLRGIVSGLILDSDNNTISGALIKLLTDTLIRDVSDASGRYVIDNFPYGIWQISVEADQYFNLDKKFSLNSDSREYDFELTSSIIQFQSGSFSYEEVPIVPNDIYDNVSYRDIIIQISNKVGVKMATVGIIRWTFYGLQISNVYQLNYRSDFSDFFRSSINYRESPGGNLLSDELLILIEDQMGQKVYAVLEPSGFKNNYLEDIDEAVKAQYGNNVKHFLIQ